MTHEISFAVASGILAVAVVVWLIAYRMGANLLTPPDDVAMPDDWAPGLVSLSVEVPAKAPLGTYVTELMRTLTTGLQSAGVDAQLESHNANTFSLGGKEVLAGSVRSGRGGFPPKFSSGEVTVSGGSGGYVVDFRFDAREQTQRSLRIGRLLQMLLAVPVIGVLAWFIFTHVVSSADEGVRVQAVQMVQSVHVLWPPFLFYVQASGRLKRLRAIAETAAKNAAFTAGVPS